MFRAFDFHATSRQGETSRLETHGPLGTLWVGLGLGCFYIALTWLNTLLGFLLTPLFMIPATWVMDRVQEGRTRPVAPRTVRDL